MGTWARVDVGVTALVGAAVVVHSLGGDAVVDRTLYLGVLIGAAVLAWVGARRGPVEDRLVGMLIAAGVALTAAGDTAWEVLDWQGLDTDVSVADPLWFASYVVLCLAVWQVLRRSEVGRDRRMLVLDAITVVIISILVFWDLAIHAIVHDQDLVPHVRVVWAAYPVADAVLLALVARAMMSRGARSRLGVAFAVGVGLWLAADVAYLLSDGTDGEPLMDAAWMVAPVLVARSAWRRPERDQDASHVPAARTTEIGIAIVPLLVPPVLMLFADLRDETDHLAFMVVGATSLTVLALVRTTWLMRSEAEARREMALARDAALEASHAKSMFLATMSHEIRTPLTMVLGAAELLADEPLDEDQRLLVAKMRRSGDVLAGLVDDVLDFSRIEAGQVDLVPSRVELAEVVAHLVDAYAPRAARAGIRLEHLIHPGAPTSVLVDRGRLLQVLGNLLDNAAKFTPEGAVCLEVRAGEALGTVELVVSDTGIGMDEDDLEGVFESFRQVDGSTTRRYGGVGLGLAICRRLVLLMGGALEVTSERGVGSTFVVRLPRAFVEDALAEAAVPSTPVGAARDEQRTP
ncbi:hypothetical protein GCM10023339_24440 [Alloalcanivorax gelatiniphagus]